MSENVIESERTFDCEEFLERLTRAIQTCEAIHNDSRTPVADAVKLMDHIRLLHKLRRALRRAAFEEASGSEEFTAAMASLKEINEVIKADVMRHQKTMAFVNSVAQATAAVLDLASSVGALVA